MMEDVFGSGFLSHLSAVARESDDLRELVHREVFRPAWDKAEMLPLGLRLELEPYRSVILFAVVVVVVVVVVHY